MKVLGCRCVLGLVGILCAPGFSYAQDAGARGGSSIKDVAASTSSVSRVHRDRPLRRRLCPADVPAGETTTKDVASCGDGTCDTACGETFGNCPADCSRLYDRSGYFAQRLSEDGFEVDEGTWKIFDPEDCASLEHCWANNPTSPYGYFLLPPAPNEPDPDPELRYPSAPGLRSTWRLLPDEAIVFAFVTPPEVPYFSLTNYVFSRYNPNLSGEPPYGDRVETFASTGDSLNQLVLNTSAGDGESPFGKESVVIFTADAGTDRAMRDELVQSGFPESMINTMVFPRFDWDGVTPFVRTGYENAGDEFTMLFRIASADAQVPGTPIYNWLSHPEGYVFRVRVKQPHALDPLPKPQMRPQGSGTYEDPSTLTWLTQKIALRYPNYCSEVDIMQPALNENGFLCLDLTAPCFADCHDTPYFSGNFRMGPAPQSVIVAGVNHELTGKAMYVNITVTRAVDSTAFYSVVMRDLIGSADVYIPDHPGKDSVWQVKFSRDCGDDPYCFEITEDQAPDGVLLIVIVRAYLDPHTGTSGKALPMLDSEMVYPRLIKVECGH